MPAKARLTLAAASPAYHYAVEVERVVDGDTLLVRVDLGFSVFVRTRFRVLGVNCPELKTVAGKAAAAFTRETLAQAGAAVTATVAGPDKYGDRWLADVFLNGVRLSDLLIAAGHGVVYRP